MKRHPGNKHAHARKHSNGEKKRIRMLTDNFSLFFALKLSRLCDLCQLSWKLHHFGGLRYTYAEAADMSGRMMQRGREDQWIYVIISSNVQIFVFFTLVLTFLWSWRALGWSDTSPAESSLTLALLFCSGLLWCQDRFIIFLTLANFALRLRVVRNAAYCIFWSANLNERKNRAFYHSQAHDYTVTNKKINEAEFRFFDVHNVS